MRAETANLSTARALAVLASFGALAAAQIAPVRSDCAADGSVVNALTGEPIPRARVTAQPSQIATVADNAGRWSFSGLTCGRADVSAMRPGFLQGATRTTADGASGPFTLISGSPAHNLVIKLTPQAVLRGRVTDESGDPVPGAQIIAMSSVVSGGKRTVQPAQSTVTNDLGEYRLAGLRAGRFVICAQTPMLPPTETTATQDTCFPAPPEGGAVSAMAVFAGADTHVDLVLRQVHAVHVRGTVSGMPPSRGAALTLRYRGPLSRAYVGRPAAIDPAGQFDLRGIPSGSYLLVVDYFDAGHRLMARIPVDVGNADVAGVVVRLEPGITLTGGVRVESASGTAQSPRSWGLGIMPSEPGLDSGRMQWDKDRSTFSIADLAPGSYSIVGTPPAPFYLKRAMLGGRDLTRDETPITQSGLELDVVLGDDGGAIDGTVEGPDGKLPASGAGITVLRDGHLGRVYGVDRDGRFRIPNVAPGDYRIYAWDNVNEAEYGDEDWMKRRGGYGQSITVASGQTATVKLTVAPVGP
jgi:hypothetical protein